MSDPETAVQIYEGGLEVRRPPDVVLEEAQKAAQALQRVVSTKAKKVVINGEQYIEFEDWQTVGRFYGVTVKVEWSRAVDENCVPLTPDAVLEPAGFESRAVVLNSGGIEISAAEALCMKTEDLWKSRPLFQVKSMSQTRACAKALRNVLSWVIVLAGYRPTPAEEMIGDERGSRSSGGHEAGRSASGGGHEEKLITDAQVRLVQVLMKKVGSETDEAKHEEASRILERKVDHISKITMTEAKKLIDELKRLCKELGID